VFFKQNKYKNTKTVVNGIKFDSKSEAEYYQTLSYHVKLGLIKSFEMQPKIYLSKAKILLKPDFYVIEKDGKSYYLDVKGTQTPVFRIKARLWKAYMDKPLRLVKKSGKGFKLIEEIIPDSQAV
jgi:hypothetical protein